MARSATPQRNSPTNSPAKKRTGARPAPKPPASVEEAPGMVDQMRAMAGRVLEMGATAVGAAKTLQTAGEVAQALRNGKPMEAAADVLKAVLPGLAEPTGWAKTGAALRRLREATGLTVADVGAALDLKDPSLIEAWEKGRIAVPFELILRLAAVLGRNDPIGFVMKFTRSTNPDLWRSLEGLGVGKLLVQSAREREFANIYRADDAARQLDDQEFAEVLAFTRAAFEMAMAFRQRQPQPTRSRKPKSD